MSQVSFVRPAPIRMPRFAPIAADWFGRLLEVLHLARRIHTTRRDRATRVHQANELRRRANSMLSTDPRVAADMFAAADRHDATQW